MESKILSVEQKLALLQKLGACGFERIEVTSFVNPTKMPQFADADKLCKQIDAKPDGLPPLMAFVPNEKGADRLLAHSMAWIACFVSVSEAFNKRNVNATVEESLVQVRAVVKRARASSRKVRVYVSTVFGCPYQGAIAPDVLSHVLKEVAGFAPDEIALGDTIGVATPNQVREVVQSLAKYFPVSAIALHLHNTYGLAIAAAQAGYECGVRLFDGATGGIGGCPYAKGASGNVASEDLLYNFHRQGARTRFPAQAIRDVLQHLHESLGMRPQGRLSEVWLKGGDWYGV